MISDARLVANRQNAAVSTGPRTRAGKARSGQNARKHGLRTSLTSDPDLLASIVTLRSELIGEGELHAPSYADGLAYAMIVVMRVRTTRETLLKDGLHTLGEGSLVDLTGLLHQLQTLNRYEQRAQYRLARALELASPGHGPPPSRKQALPQRALHQSQKRSQCPAPNS